MPITTFIFYFVARLGMETIEVLKQQVTESPTKRIRFGNRDLREPALPAIPSESEGIPR